MCFLTNICQSSCWKLVASFCICSVWQLLHEDWISILSNEYEIYFKNLFNQYQHLFIASVIEKHWEDMKKDLWKEREAKETILSSDGRNDSPGHCTQYCTYSFADMESQSILQMNIVDVREVAGKKSNNMEIMAFEKGMGDLLRSSMVIKEIVIDGHLGISALMSEW
jgi:hypothetical protein